MNRRRWQASGFPGWFELVFVVVMAVRSLVRAWDYIDGDERGTSVVLEYAEKSLPLAAWGWLFAIAGVLMLAAVVARSMATMIAGFTLASAAYAAITVAMTMSVTAHHLDGVRSPADTAGIAVLCDAYLGWCLVRWRMVEIRQARIEQVKEALR